MALTICSTVATYPSLPYEDIATAILGRSYDLTLTFVGEQRARTLNETYRGKHYTPNVLSFPLADKHGEIYICPAEAHRQYRQYDLSEPHFVGYLFIHGCLHLKGYEHGATMDRAEATYLTKFNLRS